MIFCHSATLFCHSAALVCHSAAKRRNLLLLVCHSAAKRRNLLLALALLLLTPFAHAHVGSKDVFETVHAGPYTLYVTVRPPNVIPGVATVEVRSSGASVTSLKVAPLLLTGEASKHPPTADVMQPSTADPAFYTASVWMMAGGTWQVRFDIDGAAGPMQASVPVVAVPLSVLGMGKGMGTVLAFLGIFLVISLAGIIAASVSEARLQPGVEPTPSLRRRGRIAIVASLAFMAFVVVAAGHWWDAEAAEYAGNIYQPTPLVATLNGNQLDLKTGAPHLNSFQRRFGADPIQYMPDHGKIMHLYAIRSPGMDAAFHLHPTQVDRGEFRLTLPAMPPGRYQLYGDVVRTTGFPETLLATVDIPASMQGAPLASDDASATAAPIGPTELSPTFKLPDGYTMVWDRPATLTASTAYSFTFHLLDPSGKPATDMQPYLGMAGHAAFIKTDGTVFAHTHPEGSASMADVMLANASLDNAPAGAPSMTMSPVTPDVSFPYGFPTPGRYRIFIQMKHGSTVETGVFDAEVK
jgi:hypothetical protein